jgi:hypothetical protein
MLVEIDLRDVALAPQDDAAAQRDALWHLLECIECFGGPQVRELARKRFEVFDGADVREDVEHAAAPAAEHVFALDW